MSWLSELFHFNTSDLDDDELERKRKAAEQAAQQAERVHENVVIPMARDASKSMTVNHYAEVLARAYNLRKGNQP
jgi:hypothetical protein